MNESQKPGFIGRWSKRKSQARQPAITEAEAQTQQPAPLPEQPAPVAKAPAEPVPPIESLTEDSSYERFMQPDISADIRRLALKKLFKAPVFGIRDGLDDYDDDFTTFEALGNIVTADMKFHQERKELLAQEKAAQEQLDAERLDAEQQLAAEPSEARPENETPETHRSAEQYASANDAPLITIPLKPTDPFEPAPPILASDRTGLSVRAVDVDQTPNAKES